jgi:hypothetical protein
VDPPLIRANLLSNQDVHMVLKRCLPDVNKWSRSGRRRRLPRREFSHMPSHTYSRGAILPIGIFFLAVLCVGIFSVYNMAQVTSDKRRLVNAADAIAYSTAP